MPFLDRPDARIFYESLGRGPPLLLMAATAFPGSLWAHFDLDDLARDFQVIFFDQRGTGRSTISSADVSTPALAADALALLDHLGLPKAHVFGHSNGGRVAQYMAIHNGDRLMSLMLASTGGSHKTRGVSVDMCVKLVNQGYLEYSRTHAIRTGCRSDDAGEQKRADAFLEDFLATLAPLETFLRFVVARQETDTTAGIADCKIPTLIMVGENEGRIPGDSHMAFAQELKGVIANSDLVVIRDQGHFYPFLQPAAIHKLIRDFLA
jgi:pimeloyl-ACP methyl ester carboxylesterase